MESLLLRTKAHETGRRFSQSRPQLDQAAVLRCALGLAFARGLLRRSDAVNLLVQERLQFDGAIGVQCDLSQFGFLRGDTTLQFLKPAFDSEQPAGTLLDRSLHAAQPLVPDRVHRIDRASALLLFLQPVLDP